MSEEKVRPFLIRPIVIDWLQWYEFKEVLGKPDYPKLTLELIEEYRIALKTEQSKVRKLEEEREALRTWLAKEEGIFI